MAVTKPTMKKLQEKIWMVLEANALFNVGDRVHVGRHPATGELGTVTKTNGHGHTFVTTDSGQEHKFDKTGSYMSSTPDHINKYLKVGTIEAHEKAKVDLERQNLESKAKEEAEDKIHAAFVGANDPIHRSIIDKLRDKSGDPHLGMLGTPLHKFYRHGVYNGSETESHIEPGHFNDLFHKITKNVRIHNASPEEEKEHGVTHYGSIGYRYEHPGGGSNGYDAGSFTRHSDGHIEITKHVNTGQHPSDYVQWGRKVVKHID